MSTANQTGTRLVQPYLFFEGRCEEAIEFYKKAIGAEVEMIMRFKDNPDQGGGNCGPGGQTPPGDKIMHGSLKIGGSVVMVSDGMCSGQDRFGGFSLSLSVATPAEADEAFAALLEGGEVKMPLGSTFFSPRFGMLQDRFGVIWMVIVPPPM